MFRKLILVAALAVGGLIAAPSTVDAHSYNPYLVCVNSRPPNSHVVAYWAHHYLGAHIYRCHGRFADTQATVCWYRTEGIDKNNYYVPPDPGTSTPCW